MLAMPEAAHLPRAAAAWGYPDFAAIVKQEIMQLDPALLPLQQGMSYGSYASADNITVMVLKAVDMGSRIQVKTGIQFTGIIGGCHCADDPSPDNEHPEYCEVLFEIDKTTAMAAIQLMDDSQTF